MWHFLDPNQQYYGGQQGYPQPGFAQPPPTQGYPGGGYPGAGKTNLSE